jgi:hypothetical protein
MMEEMTDKMKHIIIEQGKDVIVKQQEGTNKRGLPKNTLISTFKGPEGPKNAMDYLRQKFGLTIEES